MTNQKLTKNLHIHMHMHARSVVPYLNELSDICFWLMNTDTYWLQAGILQPQCKQNLVRSLLSGLCAVAGITHIKECILSFPDIINFK